MKTRYIYISLGALLVGNTVFALCMQVFNAGGYLPAILGLPLLLWGCFDNLRKKAQKGFLKFIKLCFIFGYCAFLLTLAIALGLIFAPSAPSEATKANVIIVLGGGVLADKPSKTLQHRLDYAADLAKENPMAVIILSGGQQGSNPYSEAKVMEEYLKDQGVQNPILLEERSQNTYQNLLYSADLLDNTETPCAVITSDFHVFRTAQLAKDQGLKAKVLGAPSPKALAVNNYLREYMAIYKYYLVGYN